MGRFKERVYTVPTSLTVPGGVAAFTSSFDNANAYFQPGISLLRAMSQLSGLSGPLGYFGLVVLEAAAVNCWSMMSSSSFRALAGSKPARRRRLAESVWRRELYLGPKVIIQGQSQKFRYLERVSSPLEGKR